MLDYYIYIHILLYNNSHTLYNTCHIQHRQVCMSLIIFHYIQYCICGLCQILGIHTYMQVAVHVQKQYFRNNPCSFITLYTLLYYIIGCSLANICTIIKPILFSCSPLWHCHWVLTHLRRYPLVVAPVLSVTALQFCRV